MSHIDVARVPCEDLASLDLDANADSPLVNETSAEHVPVFVEYNDEEDWYWRYGKERLYGQVFSGGQNPESNDNISWDQLHCFVTNFAWVDAKWRFLLDKPCWPLHSDVVDLVVMLYRGRKNYEEGQAKAAARGIMDVLDLSKRLSEEVETLVGNCKIETVMEGDATIRFVRHKCDGSTRGWIRSMLHRVLAFEDSSLPETPVMRTAFNLGRFNDDLADDVGAESRHI